MIQVGLLLLMLSLSGCSEQSAPAPGSLSFEPTFVDACRGILDRQLCLGEVRVDCQQGRYLGREDCAEQGQTCVDSLGCLACVPGQVRCENDAFSRCLPDGSGWQPDLQCEDGLDCSADGCVALCDRAVAERSYIGCDYWAVTTLNSQLDGSFAVSLVVANPQLVSAELQLERAGAVLVRRTLAPAEIAVLPLPRVEALMNPGQGQPAGSTLLAQGAYFLRSSVPVVVHQFNPLEHQVDTACTYPGLLQEVEGDRCRSYSNDASLLLPVHALGRTYLAMGRPGLLNGIDGSMTGAPGFVTLVGADPAGPVRVQVRASTDLSASREGTPVAALGRGETGEFELGPGDVLQLTSALPDSCPVEPELEQREGPLGVDEVVSYCPLDEAFDITGTAIESSGPVAAFSGHDCAFVPFDRWACDHLEEALFPITGWGREVLVARPRDLGGEAYLIRVLSAAPRNLVRFEPELHPPVTLGLGEFFEFESRDDVLIAGSEPLAVAQFLTGQGSRTDDEPGDPSMSLGVPVEQYMERYAFLAPETFVAHFVYADVITRLGARLWFDGEEQSAGRPIGETGYAASTLRVRRSGIHHIESDQPAGLTVYGYAPYTSYMVPGGLDLRKLQEIDLF